MIILTDIIYILYNYNIGIIYRINNINKLVIKLLKGERGVQLLYILMMFLLMLQVLVLRRGMLLHPLVSLWLLVVKVKVIKAAVMFQTFLLMPPSALRNWL